jgi:predicted MFS family arabinose efflux permease
MISDDIAPPDPIPVEKSNMDSHLAGAEEPISDTARDKEEDQMIEDIPHNARFKLAFLMICVCTFLVALDLVIVASALPAIAANLNATSAQAYWCGTGYVLTQCIMQPLYGSFSDIFGQKSLILFAIFVFFLSSIFCAKAETIRWLIAARVVGVGESW